MKLTKTNPRGLTFELVNICNTGRTKIFYGVKNITVDCPLEEMSQRWFKWVESGQFIQEAFENLTADQREFLMTGITPDEWDRMIKWAERNG